MEQEYLDAIKELKAVLETHKDALSESKTTGYIEDCISDLQYTIEKEREQLIFDGTLKVWSQPPTIWSKAQLGVK